MSEVQGVGLLLSSSCHRTKSHDDAKRTPSPSPASTAVRFFAGGDARNDRAKVLPWAFGHVKEQGATGFLFLGDMELSGSIDEHFKRELSILSPVPFYPALG